MSNFRILTAEEKNKLSKEELIEYTLRLCTEMKRARKRMNHLENMHENYRCQRSSIDQLKIDQIRKNILPNHS